MNTNDFLGVLDFTNKQERTKAVLALNSDLWIVYPKFLLDPETIFEHGTLEMFKFSLENIPYNLYKCISLSSFNDNGLEISDFIIEKHADKVNWPVISCDQKLSEEFIEKHIDKVNWNHILQKQELSDEFIKKHYI